MPCRDAIVRAQSGSVKYGLILQCFKGKTLSSRSRTSKECRRRAMLLQRVRESRRLARKDLVYDPNKLAGATSERKHIPARNPRFSATEPKGGKRLIHFPSAMDFSDNLEETCKALDVARDEILYGDADVVFLDLSRLEGISPEAAIVLLAELQRGRECKSSRKRIQGNYPASEKASKMLHDMGFFRGLNIRAPTLKGKADLRLNFKATPGNESSMRLADKMVKMFEHVVDFPKVARRRLCEAMVEAMDNVKAHAYLSDTADPVLLGEWWMGGFCDLGTNQVAFVFYDQGLGIPTTLKTKFSNKIRGFLTWSEAEMIQDAVMEGKTRRDSTRHGCGLPSLRSFIDELGVGGFLRVISNRGDFTYFRNRSRATTESLKKSFSGTLIIWSVQLSPEIAGNNGMIDLTKNRQLSIKI